jgi:hypothetical protein
MTDAPHRCEGETVSDDRPVYDGGTLDNAFGCGCGIFLLINLPFVTLITGRPKSPPLAGTPLWLVLTGAVIVIPIFLGGMSLLACYVEYRVQVFLWKRRQKKRKS